MEYRDTFRIFDKNITIFIHGCDRRSIDTIKKYLRLYAKISKKKDNDLKIDILCSAKIFRTKRKNIIATIKTSFGTIAFIQDAIPSIHLLLKEKYCRPNLIYALLFKIRHCEFDFPQEMLGQVLYEWAIIPSILIFFNNDLTLIHGSAVSDENNEAVIFTGRGGVGKTAMELKFIIHNNFNFIADDMVPISNSGTVYLNYAFPKIYSYNVKNSKIVKSKLFRNRSVFDRLHWIMYPRIFKLPFRVRRKVDPVTFFDGKISYKASLRKIFFLTRKKVKSFDIVSLSPNEIAELSWKIILDEYRPLFEHIKRHGQHDEKSVVIHKISNNYKKTLINAVKNAECFLIKIPLKEKIDKIYTFVHGLI